MIQTTETIITQLGVFFSRKFEWLRLQQVQRSFLKNVPKFPKAIIEKKEILNEDNVTKFIVRVWTVYPSKKEELDDGTKIKRGAKKYIILVSAPQFNTLKKDMSVWLVPVKIISIACGTESIEYGISLSEISFSQFQQKKRELRKKYVPSNPLNFPEDWEMIEKAMEKMKKEEKK